MKLETVWVVRDGTRGCELNDICFQMPTERLGNYMAGSPNGAWKRERHAVYTTREEATADARERIEQARTAPTSRTNDRSWDVMVEQALALPDGLIRDEDPVQRAHRRLAQMVRDNFDKASYEVRELQGAVGRVLRTFAEDGIGATVEATNLTGRAGDAAVAMGRFSASKEAFLASPGREKRESQA